MKIELTNQWKKEYDNFDIFCIGFYNAYYLFSISITILGIGIDFDFKRRIRGKR